MTTARTPRRLPRNRLAELEQRRAELEASLADARARARQSNRDDETRLRLLLGRLVREGLPHSPGLQDYVRRELPARLTQRDRDRELWQRLFPDEPLPSPPEPGGEAENPSAARASPLPPSDPQEPGADLADEETTRHRPDAPHEGRRG